MSQLPLVFPDGSIFLALQRSDPFISLSQKSLGSSARPTCRFLLPLVKEIDSPYKDIDMANSCL
ncbi:hypothetical protein PCASD_17757 [Puccinia coronata f. sp. avenae]|uniref:Uncharacterized protein n=1 Tax=Puccinia coronata f. sp. avenae TaxID=200324 RepID=A0A2N5TYQ2_9BASI|nr:hypothetical protein PCASD_17757 [Puccinia coronata f. sp. avenae]